ncbi:MAG: hypothetical protein ACON4F_02130 [Candidatus Puniceispirillaceae bacterium]
MDELIGGDGSSPLSDTDKYHGADLTFLLPYLEFVKNLTDMPEDADDVTCRLQQIALGNMVKSTDHIDLHESKQGSWDGGSGDSDRDLRSPEYYKRSFDELIDCCHALKDFKSRSTTIEDLGKTIAQLLTEIGKLRYVFYSDMLFPKLSDLDDRFQNEIKNIQLKSAETIEETTKHIDTKLGEIDTRLTQAQSSLDSSMALSARVGVEAHMVDFAELAKEANQQRSKWLLWAGILSFCALSTAASGYNGSYVWNFNEVQYVASFASKLSVVGIFSVAALWCGTIYRALTREYHEHSHRVTIMDTFERFKDAAPRNAQAAILLEAARASFQITPTGFGKSQQGDNNSINVKLSGVSSDNKSDT